MNSVFSKRCGKTLFSRYCFTLTARKNITQNSYKKFNLKSKFPEQEFRKFTKPFGTLILASLVALNATNETEEDKVKNENKDVVLILAEADKNLRQSKFEDAETLLLKALHIALPRENRTVIAYIQDQLANLYLRINKIPEAEKLFQNVVLNLVATGFAESDPAILEISLKLATIAAYNKDHNRAVTCYDYAAEESRKNLKIMDENNILPESNVYRNQKALLGMILDSFSRYLYSNLKFTEALKVTKEACELCNELFGENDTRTIVLYNARSIVEHSLENNKTALEWAQKCVRLAEKNESKFVVTEMVTFWSNLACLYDKNGISKHSNSAFKKALQYAKKSKDDNLERAVEHLISKSNTTKQN